MFRGMPQGKSLTPGYKLTYPNREKAGSKLVKAVVTVILLVSVVLMLILTIGGWSKLEGMKPINFIWCIAYLIMAYYIFFRWARGVLPMAAALGILLFIIAVIAGTGLSGTSWFDRNAAGFGHAMSLFGGQGLSSDSLGLVTVLLIPVQVLLIVFAMVGFSQGWNVELEVPEEEGRNRERGASGSAPPQPAPA
jgi:hypothetical protein